MKRFTVSCGLLGVLVLSGCTGGADLLQCQSVAAVDTELEAFFAQDTVGGTPSPEQTERLKELANEYADLDVDGEVQQAATAVSDDLRALYDYRVGVQNGDDANPDREQMLRRTAIDTFVEEQAVCIEGSS
ncbi:hypothetical protein M4D51_06450 [Microbacterium sp. p3-SID338]|uniref:hypothetical protein n=1 Tax=unclassified Microbacterium TaxID=2609290 RepID=UPI000C7FBEF0|nr:MULTISPECIES: hypothetical protein [unclassified Microbacterium]MCT1395363.1 hypothetical protein [Microbacterium sp. p3-SID338]PMC04357.1 hypothetical protein CJ226_10235 [Microbacterium sp. UMB0228]